MAQETVFAEILEEVRKTARAQQNFITKTEVEEAFSALSLSAEQMEMVYDYLRQNKIGVDEPVDADSYLEEEEKVGVSSTCFVVKPTYDTCAFLTLAGTVMVK